MKTTDDRGSGKERKMTPPICIQPCIPIVTELDKRGMLIKEAMTEEVDKIHGKLDTIFTCLGTKVPSKLFWKLVGAFILCFGPMLGFVWSIKSTVANIDTNIQVMAVTVNNNAKNLDIHVIKRDVLEERINRIEKGETYFNFHNKNKLKRTE